MYEVQLKQRQSAYKTTTVCIKLKHFFTVEKIQKQVYKFSKLYKV